MSSGIFEPTHGGTIADLLRTGMKWAAIGLVLLLMFRGDYSRAVRRLALAFAAVVMLSPIIQPWYILWFVPFLAATGIRNDWQIRCLYVGVTFFVVFGAQDQFSVWSFVELAVDASSLALAAGPAPHRPLRRSRLLPRPLLYANSVLGLLVAEDRSPKRGGVQTSHNV